MEDKKLEKLVPPLDLCKQIPDGAFADSALVWYRATISGDYVVLPRLYKVDAARTVAPAPTPDEILAALARLELCPGIDLVVNIKGEVCGSVNAACRNVSFCGGSAVTAALRLWFDVKRRG